MKKNISVVIPNFNGKHLLQQNLPSVLKALEYSGTRFEIILVDDHSTDDSIAFTERNYPQIQIVSSKTNGGFSVACNKGIAVAQYELTLLLNTDIQLPENYLESQFEYFQYPDTFGVMGKIIGFKNKEVQDTARYISRSGFKIKANNFFYLEDTDFWCPTAYLSGANALVDTQKLKAIGGFDEIFSPFYYEDFDLGLRAWRVGWKCYYQPKAFCMHDHSATTKTIRTRSWVKSIFYRNRLLFHAIHLDTLQRTMWLTQIVLTDLLFRWISFRFYFYKSTGMFLSMQKEISQSRNRLKLLMINNKTETSVQDIKNRMDELLTGQAIIKGRA
ncbi:glycosyltransferase family 2 protein [Flavihumibacter sp. R14]|nr:glycosyltransferase family 2 protein [Flavihumibacter soli]